MALDLTTFVSDDDYRARVGSNDSGQDSLLEGQIVGTIRVLERSLGLAPGMFKSGTETLTFDGPRRELADGSVVGCSRLWLRDSSGMGYLLQSVTASGVKLDTEQDGTFDGETYDPATADTWLAPGPANAATGGEPYRYLDILTHRTDRDRGAWPTLPRSIRVTGTWGWATTPELVADLVVHRTHEIREGLKGGAAGELPSFDGGIPMRPQTAWMWREVEARYGRHQWSF